MKSGNWLARWGYPTGISLLQHVSHPAYGVEITSSLLIEIEEAEDFLFSLGFRQLRVRHHGKLARIEVPPEVFDQVMGNRSGITKGFEEIGFSYTTLDLKGFRSGSMNEVINYYGSK